MKKIYGAVMILGCLWSGLCAMEEEVELREAATTGDIAKVRSLLDGDADVNGKLKFLERFPLYVASEAGHCDVVELLLNRGADPDMQDYNGSTSLHVAAGFDHREIIETLLMRGANVHATDNNEDTPLHDAVNRGYLKIAELLLDRGADLNAKNRSGSTPLHCAAMHLQIEAVEFLLAYGADPTVQDLGGRMPVDVTWGSAIWKLLQYEIQRRAETLALSLEKMGMRYDVIKEVLFRFDPTYRRREQEYREHQQREGELTL